MANCREHSKDNWISKGTLEQINAGSLQRIADATEAMSKNYVQMQKELDEIKRDLNNWQTWYYEEFDNREALQRKITAYKATVTRMKNKIAALKKNPLAY